MLRSASSSSHTSSVVGQVLLVAAWRMAKLFQEIPSNWLLHRIDRRSWYISGMIVAWGIVMTLSGLCKNYGGLIVTRLFLGLCEYVCDPYPCRKAWLMMVQGWLLPWRRVLGLSVVRTKRIAKANCDLLLL